MTFTSPPSKKGGILFRLWAKVKEPKTISVLVSLAYLVGALGGISVFLETPQTLEGAMGHYAMFVLAGMLVFGGFLGAPSALFGVWWAERVAIVPVAFASALYLSVVVGLHTSGAGNRLLQASFICVVILSQIARWNRIHLRPYDPSRHF